MGLHEWQVRELLQQGLSKPPFKWCGRKADGAKAHFTASTVGDSVDALHYLIVSPSGSLLLSCLCSFLALVPWQSEGRGHLLFLITLQCLLEAAELSLQSAMVPGHTVQLPPQRTDVAFEERLHVALATSLLLHKVPLGLQQLVLLLQESYLPGEWVSPYRKGLESIIGSLRRLTPRGVCLCVSLALWTLQDSPLSPQWSMLGPKGCCPKCMGQAAGRSLAGCLEAP